MLFIFIGNRRPKPCGIARGQDQFLLVLVPERYMHPVLAKCASDNQDPDTFRFRGKFTSELAENL